MPSHVRNIRTHVNLCWFLVYFTFAPRCLNTLHYSNIFWITDFHKRKFVWNLHSFNKRTEKGKQINKSIGEFEYIRNSQNMFLWLFNMIKLKTTSFINKSRRISLQANRSRYFIVYCSVLQLYSWVFSLVPFEFTKHKK